MRRSHIVTTVSAMASAMMFLMIGLYATDRASAAEVTGQTVGATKGMIREAVVYLEGGMRATPHSGAVIDQRDKTFVPHISVVPRGTTVQFPNHDTVFHNVYAYFDAKKFDLGMYPHGATKLVTFDKAGLVAILCNVHSDMSAYIMVVDTPYYAITDSRGHFIIRGVPPGTYLLHAWHESGIAATQSITVAGADASLTVTLTRR